MSAALSAPGTGFSMKMGSVSLAALWACLGFRVTWKIHEIISVTKKATELLLWFKKTCFLCVFFLLIDCTAGAVFQPYKVYVPIISSSNLLAFRIHIQLLGFRKSHLHSAVWECYICIYTYIYMYTCTHLYVYVKHNLVAVHNQRIL